MAKEGGKVGIGCFHFTMEGGYAEWEFLTYKENVLLLILKRGTQARARALE